METNRLILTELVTLWLNVFLNYFDQAVLYQFAVACLRLCVFWR